MGWATCPTEAVDWAATKASPSDGPTSVPGARPSTAPGSSPPTLGRPAPRSGGAAAAAGAASTERGWSGVGCRRRPASAKPMLPRPARPGDARGPLPAANTGRRAPRPPGAKARRRPALKEPPSSSTRATKSPMEHAVWPPSIDSAVAPRSSSASSPTDSTSESASANAQKRLPDQPTTPAAGPAGRQDAAVAATASPLAELRTPAPETGPRARSPPPSPEPPTRAVRTGTQRKPTQRPPLHCTCMSSDDDVPMADADAGEVLDAIATSTHAFDAQHHPTAESALASDAQHHPAAESALASDAHHHLAAESALASDAHHHLATESALASDTQQHPAAVTTTAAAQEAVPPELHHHFMHLRGDDATGSFLAAAVKRAEDAIADEYDARARLLEARCEEAAAAVRAAEEDISCLIDELAELRIISDEIIPELNCEDPEEQNQRLRAELDATTKELEWKMEKIAELQEREKEVNTLDMAGGESKLADHDLVLHELEKGDLEINISEQGDGESKVADHALMLHETTSKRWRLFMPS
ncbi:mucin-1 isoform X3 [Triticum aestivum]|uniref:mucin-1 isoform X3 n=1 Tax=Triticum aestivum TaxID=4565 RepID=UPI001D02B01C|nr:mucin-1-like isoform X3 [Triticum aestivum]